MNDIETALRQQIRRLGDERDSLAAEVERLATLLDQAEERGALAAWEEVEALLSEVLRDDSKASMTGSMAWALGPSTRAGAQLIPSFDELVPLARRKVLAVRQAIRDRDRRLNELQEQREEIWSVVAHDLRTPLTAVLGFAQLLGKSAETSRLSEQQEDYVQRIFHSAQLMAGLVEDLLTARQLERRRLPVRPRPVDLSAFLQGLLTIHQETARQKRVAIHLDRPATLPKALFDPDRVGQALGNLVQNAVKFTPAGKAIQIAIRVDSEQLRFEVSDQGPGVNPELLPALLDGCAGTDLVTAVEQGYGLGLSITRDIARLHGGRTGAENRPEGGSRFWIEIPAARRSAFSEWECSAR